MQITTSGGQFGPQADSFGPYYRPISPQRDKDVRLNSVAALPSGETSHSCSSPCVVCRRP